MKLSWLTLSMLIASMAMSFDSNARSSGSSQFSVGFYENSKGAPVAAFIDQAKSTIDIEIYEMDDPKVISSIRHALGRGVIVHIVKEPKPVGATCKVFEVQNSTSNVDANRLNSGAATCEDQQQLVRDVNDAGGAYVPFSKPDLCGGTGTKNCLEHGKIVVVDSKLALITSGNFNTTNLCDLDYSPDTCNRDYSYITDDAETVKTLQTVVEKDLVGTPYDVGSIMGPRVAGKITVGPNSLSPLVSFIESAKVQIRIENQYLKDPTMNAALIAAAKRGVKVQVVVASTCSFGRPKGTEVRRLTTIFKEFDEAGIETKMFTKNILVNGRPGYLHAKAIEVDHKRAWMGSVNGSTQAVSLNREFGIFFNNATEVKKLESVLEDDFSNPLMESWQESLVCAENG